MRFFRPSILLIFLIGLWACEPTDPPATEYAKYSLDELRALEGIESVTRLDDNTLHLEILQPLDHQNPAVGIFSQSAYLFQWGIDYPVIFDTQGYAALHHSHRSELFQLMEANHLMVEHRYYGESVPRDGEYEYLNITQAANDLHRIKQILGPVFSKPWVSTGHSKGGMTALFYKYFYPEDVAATVAYVAPILNGGKDERFMAYINQLEIEEGCNEALRSFQREILARRDRITPLLSEEIAANSWDVRGTPSEVLESMVLSCRFARLLFSPSIRCEEMPPITATDHELFDWLNLISPVARYDQANADLLSPFSYQSFTELGIAIQEWEHLKDLLIHPERNSYFSYDTYLEENPPSFTPVPMEDIRHWLENEGDHIVYVYGGRDPWYGGAVVPGNTLDAIALMEPNDTHAAILGRFTEQERVYEMLEKWLGVPVGN